MSHPDDMLSTEEAAEATRLSVFTIRNRIHDGTLPHRRIGRLYRIRRGDLDALHTTTEAPAAALPEGMAVVHHRDGWSGIVHESRPLTEDGYLQVTRAREDRLTVRKVNPSELLNEGAS